MRAIAKSVKIHPAAKKCCGSEKPAVCSRMVQYGPVRFLMFCFGPLLSRTVLYGPVWFPMVLYGPIWFCIVPYGLGPLCSLMSCMVFENLNPPIALLSPVRYQIIADIESFVFLFLH